MPETRYKMTISRTTIDKLGIKLYDKVSAVVAELIANSYDADATEVIVTLPLGQWLASRGGGNTKDLGFTITVTDNGHGIPPDDVNKYYLKVGLDRRSSSGRGALSPGKRRVMGRKGVGKLAPFGICRRIEVISSGGGSNGAGYHTSDFILDYSKIFQETDAPYYPDVGIEDGMKSTHHGTKIILSDFERRLIPDAHQFNRQLARRFGLRRGDWKIVIVDSQEPNTQFVVGDFDIDVMENTKVDLADWKPIQLVDGGQMKVSGWVAYSRESYRDEEMAGIRIYARGKFVGQTRDFGIQAGFHGEHMARSYLVGEIHADWLDEDAGEDLIRTDRQDILWATEKGEAFQVWGQELVREVAKRSSEPRRKKARQVFFEKSKLESAVRRRYSDADVQYAALEVGKLLGGIASLDELEDDEYVESLTELVLTIAPHKVLVDALKEAGEGAAHPLEALAAVFGRAHVAEFASLGQIAHERILAVDNLESQLKPETDEGVLQSILEKAPWLIHPEWTVLVANETLETFRAAFQRWYKDQYKEEIVTTILEPRSKRPDFVLLTFSTSLQIVEIKRPKHKLADQEFDRLQLYIDAIAKFLDSHPKFKLEFPGGVHATLVCDGLALKRAYQTAFEKLQGDGTLEHIRWEEFLRKTKKVHEDFLKLARRAGRRASA